MSLTHKQFSARGGKTGGKSKSAKKLAALKLNLKKANAAKIALALSMVAESRPQMNKLNRAQLQELEASARAAIAKCERAAQ